jgi:hypothetical protein
VSGHRSIHHQRPGDSGVAVVEAAVVVALVVATLLGVFETALAWRDQVALVDAATGAARIAALHPSTLGGWQSGSPPATGLTAVVAAVGDGLGGIRAASLEHVAVFAPTGPSGRAALDQVPERCRGSADITHVDRCVALGPDLLAGMANAPFDTCSAGDCPWRQPAADGTGPTSVGVYIRIRRNWLVPGLRSAAVSEVAVLVPIEGGSRAIG